MNKWMPSKTPFKMKRDQDYSTYEDVVRQFHVWFDTHIKPLFENAVEVYGWKGVPHNDEKWIFSEDQARHDTHSALVINIKENKPDTAEDILREIVGISFKDNATNYCVDSKSIEKARKYLEGK